MCPRAGLCEIAQFPFINANKYVQNLDYCYLNEQSRQDVSLCNIQSCQVSCTTCDGWVTQTGYANILKLSLAVDPIMIYEALHQ